MDREVLILRRPNRFRILNMTRRSHSRLAKDRPRQASKRAPSMALIVQKYGGTSVGDVDRIKNVAKRIQKSVAEGHSLIVVVSARSGVTNELIARAKSINERPDTREMDMLLAIGEQETIALTAMALHAIGVPAVSYTGAQAGIVTDQVFTKAKIKQIAPKGIMQDLKAGKVCIVAGFQGINEAGQITTLGRGGSDLTAIALAAACKADKCEIYTDVDGVYTTDPRIVKTAQKIDEISYVEIIQNGKVVANLPLRDWAARGGRFPPVVFHESGWCLVRARCENNKTCRFAMSAPWYVQLTDARSISRTSAQ